MQVSKISLFSLTMLLKECAKGYTVVGYTTRPGFSNGLFVTSKQHQEGKYVGF